VQQQHSALQQQQSTTTTPSAATEQQLQQLKDQLLLPTRRDFQLNDQPRLFNPPRQTEALLAEPDLWGRHQLAEQASEQIGSVNDWRDASNSESRQDFASSSNNWNLGRLGWLILRPRHEFLLVSEGMSHIEMTTAELTTKCQRFRQAWICRNLNVIRAKWTETCIGNIYAGHATNIRNMCDMEEWLEDNLVSRVNQSTYIITTKTGLDLSISCSFDHTLRHLEAGQHILEVPDECTLMTDGISIEPNRDRWMRLPQLHLLDWMEVWQPVQLPPTGTTESLVQQLISAAMNETAEMEQQKQMGSNEWTWYSFVWIPIITQTCVDIGIAATLYYVHQKRVAARLRPVLPRSNRSMHVCPAKCSSENIEPGNYRAGDGIEFDNRRDDAVMHHIEIC
jgi:hypothetical protein